MASTIDLSELEHYIKTLEVYAQGLKDFRKDMIELCKDASKFAEEQYAQYGHSASSVKVEFEPHGTRATIYAKGNAVAFFEFGTGEVGRGTYPSEAYLPSSGVPITGNWEYYYKSEHKGVKNGVKGWFLDEEKTIFLKGNKAEAEMWRTAEYIRRKAHIIISKHFQKESGGV